jgi:hypothetical protein
MIRNRKTKYVHSSNAEFDVLIVYWSDSKIWDVFKSATMRRWKSVPPETPSNAMAQFFLVLPRYFWAGFMLCCGKQHKFLR